MSWTKLKSPNDWLKHKQDTASKYDLDINAIHWGDFPQEYPCLVASTLTRFNMTPTGYKVATCFVFKADARDLLEGDGAAAAVETATAPKGGEPEDTEYRRYVTAHLFTLIHELRALKITNAERYETLFNKYLGTVDQATVSQAANVSPSALFNPTSTDSDD